MRNGINLIIICVILLTFPSLALATKNHRIKKNDTLYDLARKYQVSVIDLKSANKMLNSRLKIGNTLIIPSQKQKVRRSRNTYYKVKKGDNLTKIAKKTGISLSKLKQINRLGSGKKILKIGQRLVLRNNYISTETTPKTVKLLFNKNELEASLIELTDLDNVFPANLSNPAKLESDKIKLLKKSAYSFLGTRYRFGGTSRNGIDCSSFVQQVFRKLDVSLPRTARAQFKIGNKVASYDLQKGDLVFFRTYAPFPSHVGIYLGNTKMIHASSTSRKVIISTMDTPYFRARFIGAKRIAKINPDPLVNDLTIALNN